MVIYIYIYIYIYLFIYSYFHSTCDVHYGVTNPYTIVSLTLLTNCMPDYTGSLRDREL